MKIAIRADGGSDIGMGHIMRCLVLAKELSKENEVFFVSKIDDDLNDKYLPGIKMIEENGFIVKKINENIIKEKIKNVEADCIITDSYDVDENYFSMLKDNFNISICIDDNVICKYFNIDMLINQNFHSTKLNYKTNDNTIVLKGGKFALLRNEFRQKINKPINPIIRKIMITVGGSDSNHYTERIINELINANYKLNVIIGNGFKNIDLLKKYESDKLILHYNPVMSRVMDDSDICISACGSTLYELASRGVPTIGLILADNQKLLAEYMGKEKLILLSNIDDIELKIKELSHYKRLNMSRRLTELVDGYGAIRVAKYINNLLNKI